LSRSPGTINRHDVESASLVGPPHPREIVERHGGYATPFPERHRLGRLTTSSRPPRFHFDKHHRLAVARDDVNFSKAGAISTRKNCVPEALEFRARNVFAAFTEGLARRDNGHGPRKSKGRAKYIWPFPYFDISTFRHFDILGH
jgi:hypothetical protein